MAALRQVGTRKICTSANDRLSRVSRAALTSSRYKSRGAPAVQFGRVPSPRVTLRRQPGPRTLALRQDAANLSSPRRRRPAWTTSLPGVVEFVSYLGAPIDMHVRIHPRERVVAQVSTERQSRAKVGGAGSHVAWPGWHSIVFLVAGPLICEKSGVVVVLDRDTTNIARQSSRASARHPHRIWLAADQRGCATKGKASVRHWGGAYARLAPKNIERRS